MLNKHKHIPCKYGKYCLSLNDQKDINKIHTAQISQFVLQNFLCKAYSTNN